MKIVSVIIISMLVLFSASLAAAVVQSEDEMFKAQIEQTLNNLDDLKAGFNQGAGTMPSIISKTFGNERMNIRISANDGTEYIVGMVTKNMNITEIQKGEISKPTLNVYITQSTIIKIANANNAASAIESAIKNNEIKLKATTIGGKIKYGGVGLIARTFLWIKGWFS